MIQTAFAYVTRKVARSLIVIAVISVMGVLSLVSLSLLNATEHATKSTYRNITNSFSLQIDRRYNQGTPRGGGNLKGADIEAISRSPYVKSVTKRIGSVANLVSGQTLKEDLVDAHALETRENFRNILMITGVSDSSRETKFMSGTFRLTRGKHLEPSDHRQVLVHEKLAARNHWKIGQTITLRSNIYDADNQKRADATVPVKIKGFFSGNNKAPVTYAVESYANEMLSDIDSAAALYGYTPQNAYYQDATFFVDGEHDLDKVIRSFDRLPIDHRAYTFVKSADNFPALQASIRGVKDVASNMGRLSLIVAAIVLALCLLMWIHARTSEIGILLSIGFTKVRIIGQFVVELVMLMIPSLVITYFGSQAAGNTMERMVLNIVKDGVRQQMQASAGGTNLGGGAEVDGFNTTLSSLSLHITIQDLALVAIGCFVVTAVALLVACWKILRNPPKEILSQLV